MIKKDELDAQYSCLNRAADDEPLFVLRANDPDAPAVVEFWATLYNNRKQLGFREMTDVERNKWREALTIATGMRLWRKEHRT